MNKEVENYSQHFTLAELLVHALVIELEAVQSYKDLTDQMQECGNDDVAALFEKMSVLEAEHADKIREKAGDLEFGRNRRCQITFQDEQLQRRVDGIPHRST